MRKYNVHGAGKVADREIRRRAQLLRVAAIDEHGAAAGVFTAIDVAPAVADHPGAGEIEAEFAGRAQQQAGRTACDK